jgi:hypothetical protein
VGLLSEKDEPKSSQGQVNVLILVIEATISAIWYFSYWLCVVEHSVFCRANKNGKARELEEPFKCTCCLLIRKRRFEVTIFPQGSSKRKAMLLV